MLPATFPDGDGASNPYLPLSNPRVQVQTLDWPVETSGKWQMANVILLKKIQNNNWLITATIPVLVSSIGVIKIKLFLISLMIKGQCLFPK